MSNDNWQSRREVLRIGSVGLSGLVGAGTVTGSVSGEEGEEPKKRQGKRDRSASVSGTIQPSDSIQSKEEYYRRRTGTPRVEDDSLIGTMQTGGNPTRTNLEYLTHADKDVTLEGDFFHYADIKFTLTAFEAVDENGRITDSNGEYYYVLEFHAAADITNDLTYISIEAPAEYFVTMESRSPYTTSSVNGSWVTLKEGASVNGTGYSTETKQWVQHGTFGPKVWEPGEGGEYGIEFDGNWEADSGHGSNYDIIGFASLKSPAPAYTLPNLIENWSYDAEGHGW